MVKPSPLYDRIWVQGQGNLEVDWAFNNVKPKVSKSYMVGFGFGIGSRGLDLGQLELFDMLPYSLVARS